MFANFENSHDCRIIFGHRAGIASSVANVLKFAQHLSTLIGLIRITVGDLSVYGFYGMLTSTKTHDVEVGIDH